MFLLNGEKFYEKNEDFKRAQDAKRKREKDQLERDI